MYIFYFSRIRTRSCKALPAMVLDYLDVTVVKSGVMHYRINGEDVVLGTGDAVVFFPGDTRERLAGGTAEYWSFNAEIFPQDELPEFRGVVRSCLDEELSSIIELYEKSRCSDTECAEKKCGHYLALLHCSLYERYSTPVRNRHVENIKQYVAEHLGEPITLEQISRAVYLSPNYCNRVFRTYVGTSLSSYIIKSRVDEAMKRILRGDDLSVIASELGYRDYCYFSRQFKKTVGKSPKDFRQSYTEDESAALWHDG